MLSPSSMFILGIIDACPVNPYEIVSRIEYNRYKAVFNLADSSIYANIRAMHQKGYADYEVQQNGGMPAKKVYSLTESGLDELKASIRFYLSNYTANLAGFSIALLLMHYFSKTELLGFLENHRMMLAPIVADRQKEYDFVSDVHGEVPCIPNVASAFQVLALVKSEMETVRRAIRLLNETDTWPQNTFSVDQEYHSHWITREGLSGADEES